MTNHADHEKALNQAIEDLQTVLDALSLASTVSLKLITQDAVKTIWNAVVAQHENLIAIEYAPGLCITSTGERSTKYVFQYMKTSKEELVIVYETFDKLVQAILNARASV